MSNTAARRWHNLVTFGLLLPGLAAFFGLFFYPMLITVLRSLRPEGQRSMTTAEWILYNILEMKFIQSRRIREIADRIAISESDYYRKQRMAIEQLAKALVDMETEAANKQ